MAAEERAREGLQGAPVVAVLQNAFVTEDPDGDWAQVEAGIGHQLGVYAGWRQGTDVKGRELEVIPPPGEVIRQTTAYGTPQDVVNYLTPIVKILAEYPESHLIVRLHYPGMNAEPAGRAIELFAQKVAPQLRELTV